MFEILNCVHKSRKKKADENKNIKVQDERKNVKEKVSKTKTKNKYFL